MAASGAVARVRSARARKAAASRGGACSWKSSGSKPRRRSGAAAARRRIAGHSQPPAVKADAASPSIAPNRWSSRLRELLDRHLHVELHHPRRHGTMAADRSHDLVEEQRRRPAEGGRRHSAGAGAPPLLGQPPPPGRCRWSRRRASGRAGRRDGRRRWPRGRPRRQHRRPAPPPGWRARTAGRRAGVAACATSGAVPSGSRRDPPPARGVEHQRRGQLERHLVADTVAGHATGLQRVQRPQGRARGGRSSRGRAARDRPPWRAARRRPGPHARAGCRRRRGPRRRRRRAAWRRRPAPDRAPPRPAAG